MEQLLTRLTTGPVVLVLEDVHHLDAASCDLLARLGRTAAERPWLLVVTRRDTEGGFVPEPGAAVLSVRPPPLAPEESLELVRAAATQPLTRQAAGALTARSGGNPLFLEELVATAGRVGSVDDLPESVQDLVTSQIDRLSPQDRLVLRYAAVLGTTADLRVLEQLLAAHRADVRLAEHLPALDDFLEPHGDGQVRFRHALMRDVAYEGLPYRRRRLLHQHVGETLEQAADDRDQVSGPLSLHYFHAGRFDRAWSLARTAAARAQDKHANSEAIELLQRAVEAARRSAGEVDGDEVADVLEALGDVSHLAGRSAAAVEAYQSARRRRGGDLVAVARLRSKQARTQQRLGRVAQSLRLVRRTFASLAGVEGPAAAATRSDLATRYSLGRLHQGRYVDALSWATLAAREAEASADKPTLALAYNSLHSAHQRAGVAEDVPYARLALLAYEERRPGGSGPLHQQPRGVRPGGRPARRVGRPVRPGAGDLRTPRRRGRRGQRHVQRGRRHAGHGRYAEAEPLLRDALVIARAVGDEEPSRWCCARPVRCASGWAGCRRPARTWQTPGRASPKSGSRRNSRPSTTPSARRRASSGDDR